MSFSWKSKTATATLFCLIALPIGTTAYANIPPLDSSSATANISNPLLLTRTADALCIIKALPQKATVTLNNKAVTVSYVLIPKNAGLTADIALAQNCIGQTEELDQLAQHEIADAAINGGYFQNYDASKPMDPYGTLIKNGKLIHKGTTGSVLGFTNDGEVKMGSVNIAITGQANNHAFKIDNINHTPNRDSNSISLFTRQRGKSIGFDYGVNIVVQRGEVVNIVANTDTVIPNGGFVLNLQGDEQTWKNRLPKGTPVDYKVTYTTTDNSRINWASMKTAIGAGPLLLKNGVDVTNPAKEGFTDEQSFTSLTNRSAVGVLKNGNLILVAGINGTLDQLTSVMAQLDAIDAISLDGGASSGLYANSQYLIKPSRAISNALIFTAH